MPTDSKDKKIVIYTDGACSGNPGPGGWGAVLTYNDHKKEISGNAPDTTNNRMELQAVIEALKTLKKPSEVEIVTDSQYVMNGMTTWIHGWKKRDWKGSSNKPVKNADLWQELDAACQPHTITWQWVKGHNGHPMNERADKLATEAIDRSGN